MGLAETGARLQHVDLLRVRMPLVTPFRTAKSWTSTKEALLVHVVTADGIEGWGECSAQAEPTYLAETVDTARIVLRDHLVPRVLAGRSLDEVRGNTAARAAVECALLDAFLRADGRSLAAWLGGTSATVPAGVALGIAESPDALRQRAASYAAQGYGRIKLKIAPGHDVDGVRAVRAEVGDDVALQVDANGSYAPDDAAKLAALDDLGVQCIEQPLPADEVRAHALLARELATPICLDESITSAAVAADAIDAGACSVVSVKAARVGGLQEARRIHDRCRDAGVPVVAGGMLETGIGRAALVAMASMPNFTIPGDVAASDHYFVDDVTEPFVVEDGRLRVPTGPGLGVVVRDPVVARFTVARERIRP